MHDDNYFYNFRAQFYSTHLELEVFLELDISTTVPSANVFFSYDDDASTLGSFLSSASEASLGIETTNFPFNLYWEDILSTSTPEGKLNL